MRIQAYLVRTGTLTITASTPWAGGQFSSKFPNGKIHEELCARARMLLKEHRHCGGDIGDAYPAAKRLQTYFPVFNLDATKPLFAVRELRTTGSPRQNTPDFEVTQVKFAFTLNVLPWAFLADEVIAEATERHMEYAVQQLFAANNIAAVFIPGDETVRPGGGTEIDVLCEMGPESERYGVEIPPPAQS